MVGGGQTHALMHTHHRSVSLEDEGYRPTPPSTLTPALI